MHAYTLTEKYKSAQAENHVSDINPHCERDNI